MKAGRVLPFVVVGCLLVACANGGDLSADSTSGDDEGGTVDGPSKTGTDASSHDTGASRPDSSGGSSSGSDGASTQDDGGDEGSTSFDSGGSPDSGGFPDTGGGVDSGTIIDSGTPPVDSGSTGGQCGSDAKYAIEAAAEVASGTITFCFGGTCSAGFCCYEELSPGNICVKQ